MRIVSVSGARGAGKTSLIRKLVDHFSLADKRMAAIVNEQGQAVFDDAFVHTHDLSVKYIRGG